MMRENELKYAGPVCPLLTIAAAISGQGISYCLAEDCSLWDPVGRCCCLEHLSDLSD